MHIHLLLIGLIIGLIILILWIIMLQQNNPPKNKQNIIDNSNHSNMSDSLNYKEGDYGKYPYILYEKRDRERRLYDRLTYDFYWH